MEITANVIVTQVWLLVIVWGNLNEARMAKESTP
jgi:hypothetical protein